MAQLTSFRTDIRTDLLPQARIIKSVPESKSIDFRSDKGDYIIKIATPHSKAKLAITRKAAEVLLEHIDIIKQSRKEIAKGNNITWEEFVKTHAKIKRK